VQEPDEASDVGLTLVLLVNFGERALQERDAAGSCSRDKPQALVAAWRFGGFLTIRADCEP